jgi:hypothetical protein
LSPVRATSPDQWSPIRGYRRSLSTQDTSVFDFEDDINVEPTRTPCKRTSLDKKPVADVEPKPTIAMSVPAVADVDPKPTTSMPVPSVADVEPKPTISMSVPLITLTRVTVPSPSAEEDQVCFYNNRIFFST